MLQFNESMFCVSRRSTDTSALYVSALLGGFMNEKDRQVVALAFTYCLTVLSSLYAHVYAALIQPHIDDYKDRQQLRQYCQYAMNVSYPSGLIPTVQMVQHSVLVLHNVSLNEASEESECSFSDQTLVTVESLPYTELHISDESLTLLTQKNVVPMYRRTMQGKNVRYVVADKVDCGETFFLKKGRRYIKIG